MSRSNRLRRMYRLWIATALMFIVCTAALCWVWGKFYYQPSPGVQYGRAAIVAGSVWLADMAFTISVVWDAGSYLAWRARRGATPPVRPRPVPLLQQTLPAAPQSQADRIRIEGYMTPLPKDVVVGRHTYTPMSQRPDPDPETKLDLPPVEATRVQPRTEVWRPPMSEPVAIPDQTGVPA